MRYYILVSSPGDIPVDMGEELGYGQIYPAKEPKFLSKEHMEGWLASPGVKPNIASGRLKVMEVTFQMKPATVNDRLVTPAVYAYQILD